MPYRLRKHETVSDGCRRIILEQAASIISGLSDRGGGLDERIHDVRKRFKRLRALLRLFELKLEERVLGTHEDTLRNAAQKLAPARDATVVLAAFEEIAVEFTGGAIERIRELLAESVRHAKRRSMGPEKLAALAGVLRKTCEALSRAGTSAEGWAAVGPGISHSYRSARKQRRVAFANPRAENLHECRRLAKRLWEQMRLLRRVLPNQLVKDLPKFEKFTELLGRHHDFFLLQKSLHEAAAHGLAVAKFPPLLKFINGEMGRCLKRTRKLGAQIFALRPKAFTARIYAGWKRWRGKQ